MKFTIETSTLPQLFARTAAQATQALYPNQAMESALMETVSVEAENPSALLQHWINLVIRMLYDKRRVFAKFDVRQLGPKNDGWGLRVEATGMALPAAAALALPAPQCSAAEIFGGDQSCRAEFSLDVTHSATSPQPHAHCQE